MNHDDLRDLVFDAYQLVIEQFDRLPPETWDDLLGYLVLFVKSEKVRLSNAAAALRN